MAIRALLYEVKIFLTKIVETYATQWK